MTHALVVAIDAYRSTFRVECQGVTDACRGWVECGTDDGCDPAQLDLLAEDGDDEPELHGKRHRNLGGWMAETTRCFIVGHPHLPEAASELWDRGPVPPGRFPVQMEHDPDDDPSELRLRLIDQPDGISGETRDIPAWAAAADRVTAYVAASGDGLYDMAGNAPLYGRDLEALTRAAAETGELRALFDLQRTRMGEATTRWRAEAPEVRNPASPDLGALLKWLMDDADRARGPAPDKQDIRVQERRVVAEEIAADLQRRIPDAYPPGSVATQDMRVARAKVQGAWRDAALIALGHAETPPTT